MPSVEAFAQNLLKKRKNLKLTQANLAKKAGVSVQTISAYENGTKSPALVTAINISNALNISLDELCSESDTNCQTPHSFTKVQSLADIVTLIDLLKQGLSLFEMPCTVTPKDSNIEIRIERCKDVAEYFSKYEQVLALQSDGDVVEEMVDAWKTTAINRLKSKNSEMFELFGF